MNITKIIESARQKLRKDKGLNGDADRIPLITWVMFLKLLDDYEDIRKNEAKLSSKKFLPLFSEEYSWKNWTSESNGYTGDRLLSFLRNEEFEISKGKKIKGLFNYLRSLRHKDYDIESFTISSIFKGLILKNNNGYILKEVINTLANLDFKSSKDQNLLSFTYENLLKEMRDAAGDAGEFYTPRPLIKVLINLIQPKIGDKILDPACGTGGFLVEAFNNLKSKIKTTSELNKIKSCMFGFEAKNLPYLLCSMNLFLNGIYANKIDPGNALRFPLNEIGEKDKFEIILSNPPFGGEEEAGVLGNFPPDKRSKESVVLFIQLILRRLKKNGKAIIIVPNTTMFYPDVHIKIRKDLVEAGLHTILRLPKGVFEPYTDIETNVLIIEKKTEFEDILFYQHLPPQNRKQYSKTKPLQENELKDFVKVFSKRNISENSWLVSKKKIIESKNINLDLKNPNKKENKSINFLENKNLQKERLSNLLTIKNQEENNLKSLSNFINEKIKFKKIKLNELLTRKKRIIEIEDQQKYNRVTIQVKSRGIKIRDSAFGRNIGTKKQFLTKSGDFLLSKIDARYGAFGVVNKDCDNAIITGNFWSYEINKKIIDPDYLNLFISSKEFMNICINSSFGATNRKYLQEDEFLSQNVKLPNDLKYQRKIVSMLYAMRDFRTQNKTNLDDLNELNEQFYLAVLSDIFK